MNGSSTDQPGAMFVFPCTPVCALAHACMAGLQPGHACEVRWCKPRAVYRLRLHKRPCSFTSVGKAVNFDAVHRALETTLDEPATHRAAAQGMAHSRSSRSSRLSSSSGTRSPATSRRFSPLSSVLPSPAGASSDGSGHRTRGDLFAQATRSTTSRSHLPHAVTAVVKQVVAVKLGLVPLMPPEKPSRVAGAHALHARPWPPRCCPSFA